MDIKDMNISWCLEAAEQLGPGDHVPGPGVGDHRGPGLGFSRGQHGQHDLPDGSSSSSSGSGADSADSADSAEDGRFTENFGWWKWRKWRKWKSFNSFAGIDWVGGAFSYFLQTEIPDLD